LVIYIAALYSILYDWQGIGPPVRLSYHFVWAIDLQQPHVNCRISVSQFSIIWADSMNAIFCFKRRNVFCAMSFLQYIVDWIIALADTFKHSIYLWLFKNVRHQRAIVDRRSTPAIATRHSICVGFAICLRKWEAWKGRDRDKDKDNATEFSSRSFGFGPLKFSCKDLCLFLRKVSVLEFYQLLELQLVWYY
jgi:hypothetical protein